MTLQAGCWLAVAPSFHLPVHWAQRVLLGAGVERAGEGFSPRPPWRCVNAEELALLVPPPDSPAGPDGLAACLCLFVLPQHLRAAWWRLCERVQGAGELPREEFDALVIEIARLLDFKDIPVPAGAVFELVLGQPGQRSSHWHGHGSGLRFNLPAATPLPVEDGGRGLWGGINLGDEPTSLVFINLSAREMLVAWQRRSPEAGAPAALAELAERFLTACPDYPPVRLRVEPGEGFRLPAGGVLVDGCTLDKDESDVLLLMRAAEAAGRLTPSAQGT